MDDVRAFYEDAYGEVLAENGVEGMHPPGKLHICGNSEMTARDLHSPVGSWGDQARRVLKVITDENLRSRMRLVLECSD